MISRLCLVVVALLGATKSASAQQLLVAANEDNLVRRFNGVTGQFLGNATTGDGCNGPHWIVRAPNNSILVSCGSSNVKRYDATTAAFLGDFVTAGSGGLNNACGLLFATDGSLLVASAWTNDIKRYDGVTGAYLGVFASGGGLVTPVDMTFGPDGNLYVCSSGIQNTTAGRILCYNGKTGAFITLFAEGGGLSRPKGLTFGPNGNLYVASNLTNDVKVYDGRTGAPLGTFTSGASAYGPEALLFGPDGNLYVSARDSHAVKRYNGVTGAFIDDFALGAYPCGMVFLAAPNPADLTSDGRADLLLQNDSDRSIRFLTLAGSSVSSTVSVSPTLPENWRVVAVGDFNMDQTNDIVVQNTQTRAVSILYMNRYGGTVRTSLSVNPTLPIGWQVMCATDVNGDGWPDLVVENASTQQVSVLTMVGSRITGSQPLSQNLAPGWLVVGSADFNGDGKADIVVQNSTTRQISVLTLNGTFITGSVPLNPTLPANWTVRGVGDYNGDGKPDLLVQNSQTGQVSVLTVAGLKITSSYSLSPTPLAGWSLVGPK